jgi:8-oxo-dGTP pyrophosphatase MutT (NUDIX family)
VLRDAGVLIAVMAGDVPRVLLTKRASGLKHHPGQIAFPGGKVDPADDGPIGAALRETEEEVGLPRGAVEVLGTLPTHETVTGYVVTPVIGWIGEPFAPVPEAGEVAEVFAVPFVHVTDPERFVIQSRMWRGTPRRYYAVPWGPYYIWGATARMLRVLADRMRE